MANHLKSESSPYLQQHKNNPVHWYPWCDEAFKKAKDENRPIFISIGYSSCHWCHVMEEEVFEDKGFAEKLNKDFVCIKVDREERPDIDKFYQEAHLLLNRRAGGWPTSIFATPENKIFFAGTYIPPQTQNNTLGFEELIDLIALKVKENDTTLFSNADEIQELLQKDNRPAQAAHLSLDITKTFVRQCEFNFDQEWGGFSPDVKFPQVSTLKSLLDIAVINGDKKALTMAICSLDNMIKGGIYDLVEGGFCRYSTEKSWLIPHFEKMTYDNALLSELFIQAFRVTKNQKYLNISKETLNFMCLKMSKNNLFYSASDADSDGVEGKYFMYDFEELMQTLQESGFSAETSQSICKSLSITPEGNFEGRSIIRLENKNFPEYEKTIQILNELRKKREYPFIDRKITLSWNAMMIKSLYLLALYDEKYLTQAEDTLHAVLDKLYVNEKLYHTTMVETEAKIDAFLEDYAYLCTALLQAYQTTLKQSYLDLALKLCDKALKEFYEGGKWYFSKGEFVTDADISDSSYAGSVGVMVDALLSLAILVDKKYRDLAFSTLEYYSLKLTKKPVHSPYLFHQSLRYLKEDRIIKGDIENLHTLKESFIQIDYPYLLRQFSPEQETLLCGVQSCFTTLDKSSDLKEEVNKSL